MYAGVPRKAPLRSAAAPRSSGPGRSRSGRPGRPSPSRMLAGLMSRWTIPRAWAWCSASATSASRRATVSNQRLPWRRSSTGSPPRRRSTRSARRAAPRRRPSPGAPASSRRGAVRSPPRGCAAPTPPRSAPSREVVPPVLADRVDRDDVGVVQRGRGPGLALEADSPSWAQAKARRQQLQRDAARASLLRLVDHAHAAAADLPHQLEVAEVLRREAGWPSRFRPGGQRR